MYSHIEQQQEVWRMSITITLVKIDGFWPCCGRRRDTV